MGVTPNHLHHDIRKHQTLGEASRTVVQVEGTKADTSRKTTSTIPETNVAMEYPLYPHV